MGDRIDDLAARVQAVETKMDQVPASIDQRFDAVDRAIVEQRQYTEFAFDKLERRMNTGFAELKSELAEVKAEFSEVKGEVRTVSSGLGRLERKLDQFIDRHLPPTHPDTQEQPT